MSDDRPFHNPFGALGAIRDTLPERAAPTPAAPPPARAAARPSGPARAVVRMERTGRGGKEVTVVDHLGLAPKDREVWLKALKGALGCGGVIEDDRLVLQGDHRKRLPALLEARGVR
jgi:translation initiation factor 1